MSRTLYFSGTIGDAFIAFCKLYSSKYLDGNFTIRRLCRISGCDATILKIAKLFSLDYNTNYLHFNEISEIFKFVEENPNTFINIYADGNGQGKEPNDPHGVSMEPYPQIIQQQIRINNRKKIGIQINTGSNPLTEKVFCPYFLNDLVIKIKEVIKEEIEIYLIGTNDDVSLAFNSLESNQKFVYNFISKLTFEDWLNQIVSLDLLISFDGFPLYFALSQKIRCIGYYLDDEAEIRIHTMWKRHLNLVKLTDLVKKIEQDERKIYKYNSKNITPDINNLLDLIKQYL